MLDMISSQTTKARIMNAAEDIVIECGASHVTFDELVKRTGLSKGGILYHYPSKKALLRDMVARMIDGFEEKRVGIAKQIGEVGMGGAKTYILASFDVQEDEHLSGTAMMAAAANDPELLGIVREHYQRNFAEIRAMGKNSTWAMMLFLATDGIWLLDALRLCDLNGPERDDLKNLLLTLSKGDNHET